ncbi:MAG: hypothetical protein FWF35_01610 [Elusimicrobia bacterium]|nr:hypothetical protein [Elusimicrobiota bacterium]
MKFLGRIFLIIFAAAVLAACEGEQPPHWWDPSGKYSNLTPPQQVIAPQAQPAAAQPAQTVQSPAPEPQAEETFTPVKSASVEVDDLPVPSVLDGQN